MVHFIIWFTELEGESKLPFWKDTGHRDNCHLLMIEIDTGQLPKHRNAITSLEQLNAALNSGFHFKASLGTPKDLDKRGDVGMFLPSTQMVESLKNLLKTDVQVCE